jgi:hypothetical protein
MAGVLKVDSINADSNLSFRIANTAVAFIDSTGLKMSGSNLQFSGGGTLNVAANSAIVNPTITTPTIAGQATINSGSSASAAILNSTNAGGAALNIQNSGTVNALLGGYNSIVGSGNATDVMLSATQGVLAFGTGASSAERMRINEFGVGLGGAIPSSGTGITFPATQSASSNANTLDDYEEGDWTPSFTFSINNSASFSYTQQIGRYTKIGRLVTVFGYIAATVTKSNAIGDLQIAGLPFTPANLTLDFPPGSCFSGGFPTVPTGVLQNSTLTQLYLSKSTSQQTIGVADLNASDTVNIRFSYTYIV